MNGKPLQPGEKIDPARVGEVRARLLAWFAAARRDLPWRRTRDPYRIWLSETMLQQTRVEAAIPYYERFLARWPTLVSLAEARDDDVMAAWAGLGYYARARNLLAAARACATQHDGRVPDDEASLRALAGVGPYTAGAVLSIAYGRATPAVDGNVVRVLSRLERIEDDVTRPAVRRRIDEVAAALVPEGAASDWNQAVMELGALVCIPDRPRCLLCPLSSLCLAKRSGVESTLPRKPSKKAAPEVEVSVAVVVRPGSIWLEKRPGRGLLASMWAPPCADGGIASLGKSLGVRIGAELARWRHAFTHRVWVAVAHRATPAKALRESDSGRWWPLEKIDEAGIPTAFRPAIEAAQDA